MPVHSRRLTWVPPNFPNREIPPKASVWKTCAASDDYLRESALANDPPSKTFYDPERDGIRCRSLGVHEHWNNGTDKKYSRNLGKADGIELFQV